MNENYVTITFEVDSELYEKANAIIERQGFTMEQAIKMFFEALILCKGLPFEVTQEELEEARRGYSDK
jgi:addiction module RelB/DinJ family antitoxin